MTTIHNTDDIEVRLMQIGLTQKQTKIYLAAMQLGTASVQGIAEKARLERTNTYDAITDLIDKGLMSITTQGKRRYFTAEPPESLEFILKEKEHQLNSVLPELRSLYNNSQSKPKIQFYPGVEGYKHVYESTNDCQEKLLIGIFSAKDMDDVLGQEFANRVIAERIKRGIRLEVIRSHETEIPGLYPSTDQELREARLAPKGMVFPLVTYVFDNKVIYLSSKKETFGLIVESADIAQAHRNYFEALWRLSAPLTMTA